MIVVVARVETDAPRRQALIAAAQKVAAASREEVGCLSYRLYLDSENENRMLMLEEWETRDDLRAHFQQPHLAEFIESFPPTIIAPPDIRFHLVGDSKSFEEISAPE